MIFLIVETSDILHVGSKKKTSGWHRLMTLKLCIHVSKKNHAFRSAVMERVQTADHPVMKKERNPYKKYQEKRPKLNKWEDELENTFQQLRRNMETNYRNCS